MKKIVVAIILSVVFSYGASGSGVFLKVGVSKGAIVGDGMDSIYFFNGHSAFSTYRVAPTFECGYEQSINKVISAYSGIGLQMIGNEYHAGFVEVNGQKPNVPDLDVDLYFTYLTIPVSIKFFLPLDYCGFFIAGGPRFDFLISNETDGWYRGSNFNMVLGLRVGCEANLGAHTVIAESGYDFGLNEMAKFRDESYKTGTLTILELGFRFNFSKPGK
jgi:hypothetical protein